MARKKKIQEAEKPKESTLKKDGMGNVYNFDGEIHAIDNDLCYALTAYEYDGDMKKEAVRIHDTKKEFCKKFAEYILKVDPVMACRLLAKIIEKEQPQNMAFVVKESSMNPLINQLTIGLRFTRLPGDSIYFDAKQPQPE